MTFSGSNSPVSLEFNSQSIKWEIKLLFSWGGEMIQFINIHISARKLHNPSIFSANNILHIYYTFYTLKHTYTFVDPNLLFLRQKNGLNGLQRLGLFNLISFRVCFRPFRGVLFKLLGGKIDEIVTFSSRLIRFWWKVSRTKVKI